MTPVLRTVAHKWGLKTNIVYVRILMARLLFLVINMMYFVG